MPHPIEAGTIRIFKPDVGEAKILVMNRHPGRDVAFIRILVTLPGGVHQL